MGHTVGGGESSKPCDNLVSKNVTLKRVLNIFIYHTDRMFYKFVMCISQNLPPFSLSLSLKTFSQFYFPEI